MSPIVWNGSARSMPPIWAAVGLESSGFTDSKRCDTRTRCSACKVPCAGCNRCADRGHYRAALSALHFLDDPANARCRCRSNRAVPNRIRHGPPGDVSSAARRRRRWCRLARGARIVLSLDVDNDTERTRQVWQSHLARAKWMTEIGYRQLLRGGAPH
jgi:hypothetical protein